jgi:hypothetical protein
MAVKDGGAAKKLFLTFLILLIVLRIITMWLFPTPGGDGPIYLSHTFTIINGHLFQNDIIKGYIPVFNFPYFYGLFNAPFYLLSVGTWFQTYSIMLWNIVWIVIFLYGARAVLKASSSGWEKFVFFTLAFVLSIYSNSTRSEIFMLPFFVLLLVCCKTAFQQGKNIYAYILLPLLLALVGLMHPVGGVFACCFTFLYAITSRAPFSRIFIVFAVMVLMLVLLYLPVILIDYDGWVLNFFKLGVNQKTHSFFSLSLFIKFLFYNPSFAVATVLIFINCKNLWKEALIWITCFLVINYFQRSYYFPYLFALLLWRLYELPTFKFGRLWRLAAVACFLYGFVFGFIFPLAQQLENRGYGRQFKNIQAVIKNAAEAAPTTKIWVTPEMLMPVIDKRNTRVHWDFILAYKDYMPPIDTTNVFYLTNKDQLNYIGQFTFAKETHLEMSEVVQPVKGLFTLSRHFTRSDSLGLWKVTVVAGRMQNQ